MAPLAQIASLLSLATLGLAGTPIPSIIPLAVTGTLDGCSVDAGGEYNAGGSIAVDGFTIKVPKNLIVQFPVVWAPFPQLCEAGVGGFEVSVSGNIVNGEPRAGQISMSPGLSLRSGQGYIESLTTDTMKIRGGPTLRLSDPNGVFGKASNAAPFFPVDDENPSISAFSGFPMCLPRSADDPKCPQSNRPDGATNFAAPDPLAMVPIRVGDFMTYSGIKSGGEILVFEMSATNVQVTTTASDTVPNYIFVEDAIVGVIDSAPNVEFADHKFIGFLSSCSGASVTISAIDVDPCTGEEKLRQIGSATPKNGDARCKWEARITGTNAQTPYTREYMITANNPVIETKDGIKAGQYVIPVTEWIQPEVDVPGTEPPPFRFQDIQGLVQGDYLDDKRYGPLSPFPGANPPAPSQTCSGPVDPTATAEPTANAPVAFALPIAAVQRVGAAILLKAQNNNTNIANSDLVFAWTKTSPASPSVSLTNPAAATATFNAPTVTTETSFVFEVTVSLKSDTTKSSKSNVTVKVSPTASDIVTVNTYSWISSQSGTIGVTCSSNVVNGNNKKMSLLLNNGATTLTMTKTAEGKWSYSSRSVKQPTNIQCVSDLGGKSELVTAPRRRKRGLLGAITDIF
ncbi:hypothetical protein K458DRAFT_394785 [Lentithecium fluviatile CBS 122367]|uniref:Uncharacterized protein n=1 Tax=Lentithecium fluviatile CBS 122367 TaxID=1168545 RepID=A0A6G1IKN8_9PLEO|nr:hypothetical protein K458DRAFT_394785 [Lentithecium fluviatile CBS 122367]